MLLAVKPKCNFSGFQTGNVKVIETRQGETRKQDFKLDLVCRKRAVSNSRPACQKAFLKFVVLVVFTRVSRSMQ